MIERKNKRTAKVGVFAVAHAVYWEQFPGLFERIAGYHADFVKTVEANGVEVIDFGMVDSSQKSFDTAKKITCEDVYICHIIGFCTCYTEC